VAFFSDNELISHGLIALPTTGPRIATFTGQLPNIGNNSLTVAYYGDKNYGPSYGGIKIVDVLKYTPVVKLTITPLNVSHLSPITITISIILTPVKFPHNPTGTIEIFNLKQNIKTLTYKAPSIKTIYSNLTVGQHTLTAHYLGDTNFIKRNSAPIFVRVCPSKPKSCPTGEHALCCTASTPIAWSCKPTSVHSC